MSCKSTMLIVMSAIFFFITYSAISAETVSETLQINTRKENTQANSEKNDLVLSLNQAINRLTKAKSIASPRIKLRIESLETEIQLLRVDVERSNIKNDYELSLVRLRGIINEL